ncbi:hypothetical protein DD238_008019 [Peronospora effusa]|uniref:Uncharacterized protein n=1 Tax=Peronospora effusa TaxID=542832 RepID=A0A3M6V9B5_9STRA|nr:hypothetical protein DD238_008019 [Peronospora effusa]RQM13753.1 hypothetical protein DD237_007983 [Peronospora effusa]
MAGRHGGEHLIGCEEGQNIRLVKSDICFEKLAMEMHELISADEVGLLTSMKEDVYNVSCNTKLQKIVTVQTGAIEVVLHQKPLVGVLAFGWRR